MMRRILVDYSRSHNAQKRGGHAQPLLLDEGSLVIHSRAPEIHAVDEALVNLAKIDERQSRLVELRFFGGLSIEEAASALGISPATAKREWNVAKAWLARELKGDSPADA